MWFAVVFDIYKEYCIPNKEWNDYISINKISFEFYYFSIYFDLCLQSPRILLNCYFSVFAK